MQCAFAEHQIDELRELIASTRDANRLRRLRQALTTHAAHSYYQDWPEDERHALAMEVIDRMSVLRKAKDQSKPRAPAPAKDRPKSPEIAQIDLGLFGDASRLPRRPYCSDDLYYGTRIRGLASALTRRYIQANPPWLRVWSIFDIDRPGGGLAWEAAGLPPPSWATINRENQHAHLVWGLSAPVLVDSPDMRQAPLRYLCAVESMMREKLGADPGFGGLLTKNPLHPYWETLRGDRMGYTLADLAACLPGIEKHIPRRRKPEEIGLGRNVTLFEWLRQYAYRHIRHYKGDVRNYVLWQSHLNNKGLVRNGDFSPPMDGPEVWHIAKSVAKWTWHQFDLVASDARFSALQAHRGQQGGVASGLARAAANEDKRVSARLMRAQGMTQVQIAEELGVTDRTIRAWLND